MLRSEAARYARWSAAVALVLAWERAARARGLQIELAGVPASLRSLAVLYGVDSLIPSGA